MLASLAENPEFTKSPLFIYCDGPRSDLEAAEVAATRKVARSWPHPCKTVIERDRNWGLASSVVAGVTDLCARFGRVVVVEDDLVVSPQFLGFLNSALEHYANEPQVMQISGYMFPVALNTTNEVLLLPITSTWGWATWRRAWDNFGVADSEINGLLTDPRKSRAFDLNGSYPYTRRLKQQLRGVTDSWGIRWYLSVFLHGGLVAYPPATLVQNIGHDGSGTHCKVESSHDQTHIFRDRAPAKFPQNVMVSGEALRCLQMHLRSQNAFFLRALAWLRTELRLWRSK
jgi:hypothetical protein